MKNIILALRLDLLNNTTIKTNMMLSINNTVDAERYSGKLFLKSVVSLKEQTANNNTFIYGSKTYIFSHQTDTITVYDPIKNNTFGQKPIRRCNTAAAAGAVGAAGATPDQLKDFETHQTILIYTNELTNVQSPVPDVAAKYTAIYACNETGLGNNNINDMQMTPPVLGGVPVLPVGGGGPVAVDTPLSLQHFNSQWNPDE